MNCPVCNAEMVDITVPRITSGFIWQRYRCEPCKVTARVEITFSCDDDSPSPTSIGRTGECDSDEEGTLICPACGSVVEIQYNEHERTPSAGVVGDR